MSCRLGVSPRPFTTSPFSFSEFCLPRVLPSLCRSATLSATLTPLALCHGPLPMRSRALTPPDPVVLRYARHFLPPAPAPLARPWQCLSAPARPPSLAPLPGPAL